MDDISYTVSDGTQTIQLSEKNIIQLFHYIYYTKSEQTQIDGKWEGAKTWGCTRWRGNGVLKCPLDLWIYQEIIYETQPDFIIEAGTFYGGSALFFADLLEILGKGEVITLDITNPPNLPQHHRIKYILGSSIDPQIISDIKSIVKGKKVLVVLDSDHSKDHVLKELEIYSDIVTTGSYMIVEDSNVNGHPVALEHGPGPMEAINEFIIKDNRFQIDLSREKFMLTFNPSGYLIKIKDNVTD